MSELTQTAATVLTMLKNLPSWFDKAEAFAEAKGFPAERLLSARLAPDQFDLARQIQVICDTAKFMGARLAGIEAPKHADTETTFDELRARVDATVAFLESITDEALDSGAERMIRLSFFPEGIGVTGANYAKEFVVPNFFFHYTTAYAILRHNGVMLGKRDYITTMSFVPMV